MSRHRPASPAPPSPIRAPTSPPGPTASRTSSATTSLKVNAILNEIDGKDHLGSRQTKVPNIFGMNFQAVSVGQKLVEKSNNKTGGYLDAAGTPTEALLGEIKFVDASIGAWVSELKSKGLYSSTLIVITAKHGQSPIDSSRYVSQLKNGTSPATLLSNAGYIPDSESTNNPSGIGPTEDDVSLLWLKSSADTDASVKILEDNASASGIALGQIYYGNTLSINYNDPTVDPRTPDIIVTPNVGVTYSGSSAKLAEHGGFAHDDTNVMLLLSNPSFQRQDGPCRGWDRPGGANDPESTRHQSLGTVCGSGRRDSRSSRLVPEVSCPQAWLTDAPSGASVFWPRLH